MKARYLAPIVVVLVLLAARAYLAAPGSAPTGQPSLVALTDLDVLRREFNNDMTRMRVIVLVSPTCPYCLKGAATIAPILEGHRDRPLAVYVVWQPIQPTDWGQPGTSAMSRIADSRARQYWDADHLVARALERSFETREPVPNCCYYRGVWWDMLAVFPPGAEWTDRLPDPVLLEGKVEDAAPAFAALLDR